jgi:hypothetical protein
MKLEINAIIQGRPAYSVIELPEVKWMRADATVELPANILPDSIQRVDLVEMHENRVVKKVTLR